MNKVVSGVSDSGYAARVTDGPGDRDRVPALRTSGAAAHVWPVGGLRRAALIFLAAGAFGSVGFMGFVGASPTLCAAARSIYRLGALPIRGACCRCRPLQSLVGADSENALHVNHRRRARLAGCLRHDRFRPSAAAACFLLHRCAARVLGVDRDRGPGRRTDRRPPYRIGDRSPPVFATSAVLDCGQEPT